MSIRDHHEQLCTLADRLWDSDDHEAAETIGAAAEHLLRLETRLVIREKCEQYRARAPRRPRVHPLPSNHMTNTPPTPPTPPNTPSPRDPEQLRSIEEYALALGFKAQDIRGYIRRGVDDPSRTAAEHLALLAPLMEDVARWCDELVSVCTTNLEDLADRRRLVACLWALPDDHPVPDPVVEQLAAAGIITLQARQLHLEGTAPIYPASALHAADPDDRLTTILEGYAEA